MKNIKNIQRKMFSFTKIIQVEDNNSLNKLTRGWGPIAPMFTEVPLNTFYLLTTVKIYLQGISKLISNPVVNGRTYQLL